MIKRWTEGLDEEQTKDIKSSYIQAILLRRRLRQLLEDKIEETRKEARQKVNYNSPSWPHFQADKLGYERALADIIQFLED